MLVLSMTPMAILWRSMLLAIALEPTILKKVHQHFWKNEKPISPDHDHWPNQARS